MSDLADAARSLLIVLRALGRALEVSTFEHKFSEADWVVTEADVLELSLALAGPAPPSASVSEDIDERAVEEVDHTYDKVEAVANDAARVAQSQLPMPPSPTAIEQSKLPDWLRQLTHLEPFLLSLDDQSATSSIGVLEATSRLLSARSLVEVKDTVQQLFVEELGFEEDEVDETSRLASQKSLTAVWSIARHEDFVVLVVANSYLGPHATNYLPAFQLHPHAIVISRCEEIDRMCVVYRDPSQGRDTLRYLTLVGSQRGRHPHDTLAVHARRFALMRPRAGDDTLKLERRARVALASPPSQLAKSWRSTQFERCIPGTPWGPALSQEIGAFLQEGRSGSERLFWGLEATLRHHFPLAIQMGNAQLALESWTIVETSMLTAERWSLISRRATRGVRVELRLAIQANGTVSERFLWNVVVPLPDSKGELIIDGQPVTLCFDLDAHEAAPEELDLDEGEKDDDDDDENEAAEVQGAPSSAPVEWHLGDEWTNEYPTGVCSLDTLWAWLIAKKLQAVSATLYRLRARKVNMTTAVQRQLQRIGGDRGDNVLLSLAALGRFLKPQEDLQDVDSPLIRCATDSPPGWACLEASSVLEDAHWHVVGGAYAHPAGGLAVPVPDRDRWSLALPTGGAFDTQPRWTAEAHAASPLAWWVARHLLWFARASPGSIDWPRVSNRKPLFTSRALRTSGTTLRILVSQRHLTRHAKAATQESLRVVDIPNPHNNLGTPHMPQLCAGAGQLMVGGDLWLEVPGELWPQGASLKRHNLERALAKVAGDAAPQNKHHELHLGPDEAGVVVNVAVVSRPGRLGDTEGWRASIRLLERCPTWVAALTDGRAAVVEVVDDYQLPYRFSGDVVDVVVEDPNMVETAAMVESPNLEFLDPATGELVDICEPCDVAFTPHRPRSPACAPDVWLRYRWLEGDGMPSDASAPFMTTQTRWWLAGAHPSVSASCDEAEQATSNGYPPFIPSLQRILVAAHLEPLASGPLAWRSSLDARPTEPATYDPTIRRPQYRKGEAPKEHLTMLAWHCGCGVLVGQHRALETCRACDTRVLHQPRHLERLPHPVLRLPNPVLHPWWLPCAAALLGLAASELIVFAEHQGPDLVRRLLKLAQRNPLLRAQRRLEQRSEERVNMALATGISMLNHRLTAIANDDDTTSEDPLSCLWIDRVFVPPELYRMVGAATGAPAVLAPSLLLQLRRLKLAIEQAEAFHKLRSAPFHSAAWVEVQRAVSAFFGPYEGGGDCHEGSTLGSVSATLRRIWPTTRPPQLRHTIPGQYRSANSLELPAEVRDLFCGTSRDAEDEFEGSEKGSAAATSMHVADRESRLALIGPKGAIWIPEPTRDRKVDDPRSWRNRRAFDQLLKHYIFRIAALAAACDDVATNDEPWSDWQWPTNLSHSAIGRLVLRELWESLATAPESPTALHAILNAEATTRLPGDAGDATAQLETQLRIVAPGDNVGARMTRYFLAKTLTGFQQLPRTVRHPYGGIWSPNATLEGHRVLPSGESELWRLLPAHDILHDPVRRLMLCPGEPVSSSVVRAFMRLEVPTLPAAWWTSEASFGAESVPADSEAVPVDQRDDYDLEGPYMHATAEEPAVLQARVFTGSVAAWLQGLASTKVRLASVSKGSP